MGITKIIRPPHADDRAAAGKIGRSARLSATFQASLQPDGTLELLCYGEIVDPATLSMLQSYGYDTDGFISSSSVKKAIDQAARHSRIRVRINSPGGVAFEGIAIHNILRSTGKPIETQVDGVAASAASIIAMAGDVRSIGHSAMMMIHNAWTNCTGFASDMRQCADTLDRVSASIRGCYVDATGQDEDYIQSLMDAQTWMSADDCVRAGFATELTEAPDDQQANAVTASFRVKAEARAKSGSGMSVAEAQRQLDLLKARSSGRDKGERKARPLKFAGRLGLEEAKSVMEDIRKRS